MKQKTHLKEEMKEDLMRVYRVLIGEHTFHTQQEAYEATVRHKAPRFYVDARWALQRLSPLMRGDRSGLERMSGLQREMYEALFEVVMRLSQKERFWGASLNYIVRHAVMEPAPRFYISAARMGQIWKERRKRVRKRDEG
ncbi:MAG: hypothetical protein IJ582_04875 [Prevotella sp.]|nr:hypothetical protein [Prevotella sp.]